MTQIVDKRLKAMCDGCKSNFDKPCAWLSLGNEYCTGIMEIQQEIDKLKAEEPLFKLALQREDELHDRIDRAIEYIEQQTFPDYERQTSHNMYDGQIFELLNILKGEGNNDS